MGAYILSYVLAVWRVFEFVRLSVCPIDDV